MTDPAAVETTPAQSNDNNRTQPISLRYLFMTELWERYAYYGMTTILVLFMAKVHGFSDHRAYHIFGAFGAMLFLTPVIGGYLADRILGYKRAISFGGVLLALGYLGVASMQRDLFFPALAMLVLGNGFLKPNISTILGTVYEPNDPRRESGFTLFYIGINIGGTVGTLASGYMYQDVSWSASFLMCAIAICIGLVVFGSSFSTLRRETIHRENSIRALQGTQNLTHRLLVYLATAIAIMPVAYLIQRPDLSNEILVGFALLLFGFIANAARGLTSRERGNLIVIMVLIVFSVAFWSLYQQTPMSIVLFLSRDVNLHLIGNVSLPPTAATSLNGIFLLLLAPFVIRYTQKRKERGRDHSLAMKFAMGIIMMGAGFLLLQWDASMAEAGAKAPLWPIVASYGIQTLGELFLSPVGLAMVTMLAPQKLRGLMMGVWFFALAGATAIGGEIAGIASVPKTMQADLASAPIYSHAFFTFGAMAVTAGVLLLLCIPVLNRFSKIED